MPWWRHGKRFVVEGFDGGRGVSLRREVMGDVRFVGREFDFEVVDESQVALIARSGACRILWAVYISSPVPKSNSETRLARTGSFAA